MNDEPAPAATATESVVRATGVRRVYGHGDTAVEALRGVDLSLEPGKFVAIMGPSGSGKSTLMHILAGIDRPTDGHVWIGDQDITALNDKQLTLLRRRAVGFVFQFFNLLPMLTAEENMELPHEIAGTTPDPEWRRTLVEATGLGERLTHRPAELSGGQQQRVAIARALLSRPDVVFADEPTGNLDSRTGQEILSLLRRSVDDYGQTIVMVTHDPFAASIADRVLFLQDGLVVQDGGQMDGAEIFEVMKGLE